MPIYPSPENVTGLLGLMQYANSVTDNYWGWLIILSTYLSVFLFLVLKKYPADESMMSAGFLTVFVAVLMNIAQLIDSNIMLLSFVGLVVPIIWMYWSDR